MSSFSIIARPPFWSLQNQPSRGVLRKRCSAAKYAAKLQEKTHVEVRVALRDGCSPVNLLHIYRKPQEGYFCPVASGLLTAQIIIVSNVLFNRNTVSTQGSVLSCLIASAELFFRYFKIAKLTMKHSIAKFNRRTILLPLFFPCAYWLRISQ